MDSIKDNSYSIHYLTSHSLTIKTVVRLTKKNLQKS